MKKILAVAFLLTATFIGTASAEEIDPDSAIAAPAEINHPDSIYYTQPNFFDMASTADRVILTHYLPLQQRTAYSCGSAALRREDVSTIRRQEFVAGQADHRREHRMGRALARDGSIMLPKSERNQPWLVASPKRP